MRSATHTLKVRVSHGTIYRLRHGEGADCKLVTLFLLAKELKVRPAWLILDEGSRE